MTRPFSHAQRFPSCSSHFDCDAVTLRHAKPITVSPLTTGVRAEFRARSPRPIRRVAMPAQAGSRFHRHRSTRMEYWTGRVVDVEAIPTRVIHAAVLRARNPFQASDDDDIGATRKEGRSLPRVRPIRIEKQPRGRNLLEVTDQRMQKRAAPWWIRDDRSRPP